MRNKAARLTGDRSGAVAPTVALSLFALVAVGGLAFDYARLAGMDTELQNAADQAALAAASQLDGKSGACSRASGAAVAFVANDTRFSNDGSNGGNVAVTVTGETSCDATGNIKFWQDKTKGTAADSDANARFVEVTVNGRQANYALTPVVAAFNSGLVTATAMAGLGSAICKVPPLMMCNPSNGTFDPDSYKGVGLKLIMGGGNSWAPGVFGYLDVGQANNGTPDQRIAMAYNNPALTCASTTTEEVDTGLSSSVFDALNVRFDIFENGWANNNCANSSTCSPARNTTKDMVRKSSGGSSCGITNNPNSNGWWLPADADQYIAQNSAGDDATVTHMGYPMDICHYPLGGGGCTRLGNGNWRRDIYFQTNHPTMGTNWQGATGLPSNATRYEVYKWEQSASGSLPNVTRASATQHGAPTCNQVAPSPALSVDRRVVAVAVVNNCGSLSGASTAATIGTWADVFLTMPAGISRSAAGVSNSELYVEIIGRSTNAGNGSTPQTIRRDTPYLVE
jgi:Flp pilus assembly protein TadG